MRRSSHLHGLRSALVALGLLAALSPSGALAGGFWSDPVMVGEDDDYSAWSPGVAVSTGGTAFAVWSVRDPDETDDDIFYVTVSDSGQSEQRLLHEPNTGMDRIPIVSGGADGVPWVIWERYGDGYEQVVSHWNGNGWTPPETVFDEGGRYDWYTIHAADTNNVVVARDSRVPGRSDRDVFLRQWDGQSWSDVVQLGFVDEDDQSPVVATDSTGRAFVAWVSDFPPGSPNRVYAAVRDTAGWSAPAVVDTAPGNIVMCDLDFLPDGRPIAVWMGNGYVPTTDIEYAVLEDGGWRYAGLVNEPDVPGLDDDKMARLSRNGFGELWAIWSAGLYGAGYKTIVASRWMGDGWSREELVSVPDTNQLVADGVGGVAVSESGTVWAVWRRMQEEFPWDYDVFMATRRVPPAEGVSRFSAVSAGSAITVSWHVSGAWADEGFHVWRMIGEAMPEGTVPGTMPPAADRITDERIADCADCSFTDHSASEPGTYWYWIGGQREGPSLGPARAKVDCVEDEQQMGITAVRPNPAADEVCIDVAWHGRVSASLRLFTPDGRLVRTWPIQTGARTCLPTQVVLWDGTDSSGRRLPSGIYFAALVEEDRSLSGRVRTIVLVR